MQKQLWAERRDGGGRSLRRRLYRFDADGRVDTIEEEIGIANTLAWSPISRDLFGDSLKGGLYVYDFDADSGTVRKKRTFYDAPGYGIPDGSAIDVDGCLWNARFDGGAIFKITPKHSRPNRQTTGSAPNEL